MTTETPQPSIELERIRRAAQQPIADVIWLQVALDYIDDLLEHIEREAE
jgi:hypothetical protein